MTMESETFFSTPNSDLQETRDEELNWVHFDWPNNDTVTGEEPQSGLVEPTRPDEPIEQNASRT